MNPNSPLDADTASVNPFAVSPGSQAPPILPAATSMGFESYRDGNFLAVRRQYAMLPPFCVKTNQPTTKFLSRKLYWHHPAVFLAIFISPLIYIILAFALRKMVEVQIPISPEVAKRRITNMIIAWLLALLGCLTFVLGLVFSDSLGSSPLLPALLISAPILILGGAIYGILTTRIVYAKKIDQHFGWLKGVSPEYLQRLQDWPFGKV